MAVKDFKTFNQKLLFNSLRVKQPTKNIKMKLYRNLYTRTNNFTENHFQVCSNDIKKTVAGT